MFEMFNAKAIKEITRKWAKEVYKEAVPTAKDSKKAVAVAEVINASDFGCKRAQVADLIGSVYGG